jgi:hypothetical protein
MDGRGRWMNNVFIERLWGSLKYTFLNAFDAASEARTGFGDGSATLDVRRQGARRGLC